MDPRTILVVGDTHGAYDWWTQKVVPRAVDVGADAILQLGDFGVWRRSSWPESLAGWVRKTGIQVWAIDGNHDDHTLLATYPRDRSTRWAELAPGVTHIGRGSRWVWSGVRFCGIGGAVSVDQQFRHRGVDWWEEEQVTDGDVRAAIAGGPCDVLVCHEVPAGFEPPSTYGFAIARDIEEAARMTRLRLRRVMEAVRPRLLLHGHWHHFQDRLEQVGDDPVHVVGLNCNGGYHNAMTLTLRGGEPRIMDPWPVPREEPPRTEWVPFPRDPHPRGEAR